MSGSSQKSTQKNTVDPTQLAQYNSNYQTAQNVANNPAQYAPYSGQFAAPMSGAQNTAGGILGNLAANPTNANLGAASTGATGVLNYNPSQVTAGQLSNTDLSPYMNPYTNDVINSSLATLNQQRGQQNVADNASATAAGAFGGTRQAVQRALTSGQYDMNTANLISGLNSQNYTQAQNAAQSDINNRLNASEFNTNTGLTANGQKLSASGLLGTLGQDQFNNQTAAAQNLDAYGTQQQQTQQLQDSAQYQDFLRQLQAPYAAQQLRNQSLGIIPVQQTVTNQQTSSPGVAGILGGLLGLGQTAGQLGWSPFSGAGGSADAANWASSAVALSDRRLKTDIRRVGTSNNGTPLYTYRFKGDPEPRFGVMAQEVLERKPDAVVLHPSGYLAVNYALALAE